MVDLPCAVSCWSGCSSKSSLWTTGFPCEFVSYCWKCIFGHLIPVQKMIRFVFYLNFACTISLAPQPTQQRCGAVGGFELLQSVKRTNQSPNHMVACVYGVVSLCWRCGCATGP